MFYCTALYNGPSFIIIQQTRNFIRHHRMRGLSSLEVDDWSVWSIFCCCWALHQHSSKEAWLIRLKQILLLLSSASALKRGMFWMPTNVQALTIVWQLTDWSIPAHSPQTMISFCHSKPKTGDDEDDDCDELSSRVGWFFWACLHIHKGFSHYKKRGASLNKWQCRQTPAT